MYSSFDVKSASAMQIPMLRPALPLVVRAFSAVVVPQSLGLKRQGADQAGVLQLDAIGKMEDLAEAWQTIQAKLGVKEPTYKETDAMLRVLNPMLLKFKGAAGKLCRNNTGSYYFN